MIKLIASDLDGTLLKKREKALRPSLLSAIDDLSKRGVLFAVASGRAYHELARLFSPVIDKVIFVPHDGAMIRYGGETLCTFPIDRKKAERFIERVWQNDNFDILISGQFMSYFKAKSPYFERKMRKSFHNHLVEIESLDEIEEDILKISLHSQNRAVFGGEMKVEYQEDFSVVYNETGWMEFTARGINKGSAVSFLQKTFGIGQDETMAFGDNYNDREMLRVSKESYAMANGRAEIKKECRHIIENVETILKTV